MSDETIKSLYSKFLKCSGLSIDSRSIEKNQIFFALQGPNFNGNKYASHAIERGASLAVIDDEEHYDSNSNKLLLVEDALKTLQSLAAYHRQQTQAKIIAITGSNGKTTTKELTAAVLAKKYKVIFTKGNLNNHIGVPLTLLRIEPETEIGIIEMGANHRGEIEALCEIARPDFALITNIGKAHLEGFGSIEGVVQAKGELFKSIISSGGTIFLNEDEPYLKGMIGDYQQVYYYGQENNFDCETKVDINALSGGLEIIVGRNENPLRTTIPLFGLYNKPNILAAMNVGYYFGVELIEILNALNGYSPENKRSQIIKTQNNIIILDAYNANPSSMIKAIDAFCKHSSKRKILILGDMLELGKDALTMHQEIINHIDSNYEGETYLVGEFFNVVKSKNAKRFHQRIELEKFLADNPLNNRTILIKGSRGLALEKILPLL